MERVGCGLGAWALLPLTAGLTGCARREPAPDVAFVRLDGSRARLSDLRGKVVLVNFWATSCATCVAEMPDLMQTHQRHHPRGYETLAVAMSYDPPAYVASFAERRKLPFQVAIDNTGEIARAFGDIKLTPTTFLLDRQQRVVKRYVGTPDFKALDALITDLLAEGGSS
jgi:peroxiredoxin